MRTPSRPFCGQALDPIRGQAPSEAENLSKGSEQLERTILGSPQDLQQDTSSMSGRNKAKSCVGGRGGVGDTDMIHRGKGTPNYTTFSIAPRKSRALLTQDNTLHPRFQMSRHSAGQMKPRANSQSSFPSQGRPNMLRRISLDRSSSGC